MPNAGEALVYVNEDGSLRELTDAEKTYVDTEFSPLDGARPYIKSRYFDRTASGIQGYLPRSQVPRGMSIDPPPQNMSQPRTPQAVADSLVRLLRRRG
jgi:hypothetical protein